MACFGIGVALVLTTGHPQAVALSFLALSLVARVVIRARRRS